MNKKKKDKIIDVLVKRGLVKDEKEGLAFIMQGRVTCSGKKIDKPGTLIDSDAPVEIVKGPGYVSRGGLKLESAFDDLNLTAKGVYAVDVGSSTGGFTDFLLKKGAKKVAAIDVGYGQLSWSLRKSPRVVVFERTNIRYFDAASLPFDSDMTVADLSFISIKTVFEKLLEITKKGGTILLLFKPQFELRKEKIQAKGVIKDPFLHIEALDDFFSFLKRFAVKIEGLTFSKTRGAKGNIEYWIYLTKNPKENNFKYDKMIRNIVERSHRYFKR